LLLLYLASAWFTDDRKTSSSSTATVTLAAQQAALEQPKRERLLGIQSVKMDRGPN